MPTKLEGFLPIDPFAGAAPIWSPQPMQQMLGKDDDEEDDDNDDDSDDEDDDEDDDPDADKTDEELRAELRETRARLKKANDSSARHRKRRREAEAAAQKPEPKSKADDDEKPDVDKIRAEAKAEGERAANDKLKRAAVRTALAKAGVTEDGALTRLTRMVDLDELDLNDDDSVDGLDDALDALKADMPQLFGRAKRKRESAGGEQDRDGTRESGRKLSASEKQARALQGRG